MYTIITTLYFCDALVTNYIVLYYIVSLQNLSILLFFNIAFTILCVSLMSVFTFFNYDQYLYLTHFFYVHFVFYLCSIFILLDALCWMFLILLLSLERKVENDY